MANLKVRHFVEKKGRQGPRFFWQPSVALRAEGWLPERLPDDRMAAIARAERLNAELDGWRKGTPLAPQSANEPQKVRRLTISQPQAGTLSDVIQRYRHSRFYPTNSKTRRGYEQNIKILEDWAGEAPVAAIGEQRVQKLYDEFRARTPAKANAIIVMLRILLQHAVRLEITPTNAAKRPGLIGIKQSGKLWPKEAIALFVETSDKLGWHSIGSAVLINHWLGQREGDILALRRHQYRDGRIQITQNKNGARVSVPYSKEVGKRIEAEIARQLERKIVGSEMAPLLLCETTGRAWKEDHFRHVFAEIRQAAAKEWETFSLKDGNTTNMLELQFMHLRHTAVTELATAGCTALEISGITGHTPKSVEGILSRYLIRTSDLADAAMAKRMDKNH